MFTVGLFALAACQAYDFEAVETSLFLQTQASSEIGARPLPPHLMLLLDKSGSMNEPGSCDSPPCPARIDELRNAMVAFLGESLQISEEDPRPLGKFGLTLFPADGDEACAPAKQVQVEFANSDEDAALKAKIEEVRSYISQNLHKDSPKVAGGTPTGASLEYLRDHVPALQPPPPGKLPRENFILLLTDGLPNCNDANKQNDCPKPNECLCTDSDRCKAKSDCDPNCLDKDAPIEVIQALKQRGTQTIVIGFGANMSGGLAGETLNAMATAGGDMRGCGGKPNCTAYFPAADQKGLLEALRKISALIVPQPCVYALKEAPASPKLLMVEVNGKRVSPGKDTYAYNADDKAIVFAKDGELCKLLETSSPQAPVQMRIAWLKTDI